jgi:putative hemolysin
VTELFVAFLLILLNGVFALSELSIVSSRKTRLKSMVDNGVPGATTALRLAENPGRFLSTVQIGITLVGLLAGAFSGAALGDQLSRILAEAGAPRGVSEALGYGLVLAAITYLSVVVGELVPKQVALRDPEAIACKVAPLMSVVSRAAAPFVWLLDASARLIMRLLGRASAPDSTITEEEIRTIVAEAETAGVIEGDERRMIAGVLRLGDRSARALMTPRTEVDFIDLTMERDELLEKFATIRHSRLPAAEGSVENIVGVIEVRDLLRARARGETPDLRALAKPAPIVPDTLDALDTLEVLRTAETPMALVHDEYGHFEGVVTPTDILDAIAGALRSDTPEEREEAVRRGDGSWLIDAAMPVDEFADLLGLKLAERRDYETAAGFVIERLQRLPATGDWFEEQGWRIEVVDLDGRRVDKLLVSPTAVVA